MLFVLVALNESDIWPKLGLLTGALLAPLLIWRHVSVVFPYLRSGDRSLLFFEYESSFSEMATSLGLWHNFKAAPANIRVKALAWMLVALPAGVTSYLALALILVMVTHFVPQIATPVLGTFVITDLLGAFAGLGAFVVMYLIFRHGLQHIAPSARALRREDKRSPILLIRSFKDEDVSIQRSLEFSALFGNFVYVPKRLDELLEQSLRSYGPVIAIGRPKEALPSLGAAREYASDADWMSLVEARLREVQLVVAILGDTDGFVWEMSAILRLSLRQKLILVVPPMLTPHQRSDRWERISKALDVGLELPANAAVVAWDNGNMNVVTASRLYRDAGTYRMALARALNARQQTGPSTDVP
ncbi:MULTISPECIES: hypothetical protein [unclassified Bradyrhizobium]|uniref:hypothetical protein n=1 Tax=unclassified Bradyrhizobium TaxID=2631580 RepID=UPI002915F7DB|nr:MULTISPECIES: hypothetical protein [unclassified Bradyrhizobium]